MKIRSWYQTVVWTAAASTLGVAAQAQTVIYEATTSSGQVNYLSSTNEFGDQIKLAGSGPLDRVIGQFKLEYYLSRYVSGNETIQVRIYDNSGSGTSEPSSLLWDSGAYSLAGRTGYNTLDISDLTDATGKQLVLPDWVTFTVSFAGIEGNETAGLILRDAPTVGESYTDYWEKTASGWETKVLPDTQVTFGAQIISVPEPTTVQLAMLGAMGLLGSVAWRRRSSK